MDIGEPQKKIVADPAEPVPGIEAPPAPVEPMPIEAPKEPVKEPVPA